MFSLFSYPVVNDELVVDVDASSVVGGGVEGVSTGISGLHLASPSDGEIVSSYAGGWGGLKNNNISNNQMRCG